MHSYGPATVTNVGTGFFGGETEDEKRMKRLIERYKEELQSKSELLNAALEKCNEAEQRDTADRATIEHLREELTTMRADTEEKNNEIAQLRANAEEVGEMKVHYTKNVLESSDYQKAQATIADMQKQVHGLTANLSEMTAKYEASDLLRNELASALVIAEAKEKSMEAVVKAEQTKVAVANQTISKTAHVFDSTVDALQKEANHNLHALDKLDRRAFDTNRIIREAVERATQLISLPPPKQHPSKAISSEITTTLK